MSVGKNFQSYSSRSLNERITGRGIDRENHYRRSNLITSVAPIQQIGLSCTPRRVVAIDLEM
jgi:hypothetical protein